MNDYTYPDLSNEQIGLLLSHRKISGYGDVKLRVIIVDISDDYVHSCGGGLKKKERTNKIKTPKNEHHKDQCYSFFLYVESSNTNIINAAET